MNLFEPKKRSLPCTVIAGCTGFASILAQTLLAQGQDVLVIADDQAAFSWAVPSFTGRVLAGDCTDMDVLAKAALEKAMVVAATGDDNVNLLVAQLVKEAFGVEHAVAIISDFQKECVYRELGVAALNPALISAKEIAGQLLGTKKDGAL